VINPRKSHRRTTGGVTLQTAATWRTDVTSGGRRTRRTLAAFTVRRAALPLREAVSSLETPASSRSSSRRLAGASPVAARKIYCRAESLKSPALVAIYPMPPGSARNLAVHGASLAYRRQVSVRPERVPPIAAATSVTVRPSLVIASTARYRCSATLISLNGSVKDQPKCCQPSTETV
jgi:hypothetical protein